MQIIIRIFTIMEITEIKVDTEKNIIIYNDVNVNYPIDKFTSKLLAIVSSWEEKMINHSVFDGESYEVKIKQNNIVTSYIGKNKFPENYELFKDLISEVKNGRY